MYLDMLEMCIILQISVALQGSETAFSTPSHFHTGTTSDVVAIFVVICFPKQFLCDSCCLLH